MGTWAFGNDFWWGKQDDGVSMEVMRKAVEAGVNFIDTAPFYGMGHSEKLVGKFLAESGRRKDIVLATKLGLDASVKGFCNLKRDRMLREIEDSLERLQTDYIDLYQIHWPDPALPVEESALTMREFYDQGIIRAVGVSNYSVSEMKQFMDNCPLHSLQPPYNMFNREIEDSILPFCVESGLSVINYSPLHGGVLTGKFFLDGAKIPGDTRRKSIKDLKEPYFSINRGILEQLKTIAGRYGRTLSQFVLNWTMHRPGITSVIFGARTPEQLNDNIGSCVWSIKMDDLEKIEEILNKRRKIRDKR